MPAFRSPLGLVLAGGGAHGAWQAGCLDALLESGLSFDRVLGVSVGALTGASYALGRMSQIEAFWKDVDKARLLRFEPRLGPLSLFSSEPLREAVEPAADDALARERFRCELVVVSLCLDDREYHYARFEPGGAGAWDGPLAARLLASCAVPTVFPPVRVEAGGASRSYVDGGAKGNGFVSFAALAGCRDVLLLQMVRPDEIGRVKSLSQLFGDQLGRDLAHGLETLRALPGSPRVFRLFPSAPLNFSCFAFRTRHCAPAVEQGRADGGRFLAEPSSFQVPGFKA
ncbi:MAG: patatin-like phospholipase family protein [Elusimicrobia bacterium]|nr:patatin-like phospholipase family protein [Elusimicrobiota bacterium]